MTGSVTGNATKSALTVTGCCALIMLSAGMARADAAGSTIDAPAAGSTWTGPGALSLHATVNKSSSEGEPVTLVLADPRESTAPCHSQVVASTDPSTDRTVTLVASLNTDDSYPTVDVAGQDCGSAAGSPAWNGTWQVSLSGDGARASTTFTVKVPPKAPANPSARVVGAGTVRVTWNKNPEPDVDAYTVAVDGGSPGVHPSSVCSSGVCTVDLSVAYGNHHVTVGALRWTAYSNHAHLPAVNAAPVNVSVVNPSSAPSPSRASAGKKSGAAPQNGSPGSPLSGAGQQLFAQGFQTFSDTGGIAKPPPLPSVAPPPQTDGEPTADGTYDKYLTYKPTIRSYESAGRVPLSSVADAIGVSPVSFWDSAAGGALLLLGFGHVRAWMRRATRWDN